MARQPFVYILRCGDGSLYTGVAKDLARRLAEHRAGNASKYTRARRPVRLVWSRRVKTWRRALKVEHLIKQLSRSQKLVLVHRNMRPIGSAARRDLIVSQGIDGGGARRPTGGPRSDGDRS